jgi:Transmembrane secretion effector
MGHDCRKTDLRRNRNFNLLFSGSAVSMLGNRMAALAYPMLVLGLTGSSAAAGVVGFASTLPLFLLYIPFGVLVDQWEPRKALIICESCRGILVSGVVVSLLLGVHSIGLLAVSGLLDGCLTAIDELAEVKIIGVLVPRSQTAKALTRIQAFTSGAGLLGRPLCGLLFGINPTLPFIANGISFVVFIGALGLMRPTGCALKVTEQRISNAKDLAAGITTITADPYLRSALPTIAFGTAIVQELFIIFLVDANANATAPWLIGLAYACAGIGGIGGSLLTKRAIKTFPLGVVLLILWLWPIALFLVVLFHGVFIFGVVVATIAAGGVIANIVLGTYIYRAVQQEMLAQVFAVAKLLTSACLAFGLLIGGLLAQHYGSTDAYLIVFTSAGVVAVAATTIRAMREPPVPDQSTQ